VVVLVVGGSVCRRMGVGEEGVLFLGRW